MYRFLFSSLPVLWLALFVLPVNFAVAAEMQIEIDIPKLDVAEYHRPYIALWIEHPDKRAVTHLSVWYDTAMKNGGGEEWLKDLRQWWRRGGRDLSMPVDGISGATRPAGKHHLRFGSDHAVLAKLTAGNYVLVVEAVREVGGREVLNIPFQWPPKEIVSISAKGERELGLVKMTLNQ
ncbi:MAG: DUF2271 domain-containing protein [Burkholderiales bacterium]|jgi:hypothetical protein|nr:DUF2271 domain-containing protein [Burkholderiales bacterium]